MLVVLAVVGVGTTRYLTHRFRVVAAEDHREGTYLVDLGIAMRTTEDSIVPLLYTPPELRGSVRDAQAVFEQRDREIDSALDDAVAELDRVAERDRVAEAERLWRQVADVVMRASELYVSEQVGERLARGEDPYRASVWLRLAAADAALRQAQLSSLEDGRAQASAVARVEPWLLAGVAAALLAALSAAVMLGRGLSRRVVQPLLDLTAAVKRIAGGDLGHRAESSGTEVAEVADLTAAFNEMAEGLADRARLESELRHAQKMESMGRLAAGIAHEINTPIQFVGDNVRFLSTAFDELLAEPGTRPDVGETEFLAAEVPEAITQTLEGVQRVATIVRAMKAFAHPSTDEKSPVDLNEAVRNTLVVAGSELRHVPEVRLEAGELRPVWCHSSDINQVLLNLVVNAGQAIDGETGGSIVVRTRAEGDEAVIEVADTGRGIPPEIAHRVFEPFFTTKDIGTGTGQGLALAYSLVVDRHRGSVTFTSEPGQGTTFTIRVPIRPLGGDREASERTEALV